MPNHSKSEPGWRFPRPRKPQAIEFRSGARMQPCAYCDAPTSLSTPLTIYGVGKRMPLCKEHGGRTRV